MTKICFCTTLYFVKSILPQSTLLRLIVIWIYIAFFQIFHSQNHFIMTLPFYQNVKLGPTPAFYYQLPILGFFDFTGNRKLLRQDRTLFKNKIKEQISNVGNRA